MFYPGTPLYFYRGLPVAPPPSSFNRGKTPGDTFKKICKRILGKLRKFFHKEKE